MVPVGFSKLTFHYKDFVIALGDDVGASCADRRLCFGVLESATNT